jgi:hypothetical protein
MGKSIYDLEDYFRKKYIRSIVNEIKNFEFPDDWSPKQVIDYITFKIDRD